MPKNKRELSAGTWHVTSRLSPFLLPACRLSWNCCYARQPHSPWHWVSNSQPSSWWSTEAVVVLHWGGWPPPYSNSPNQTYTVRPQPHFLVVFHIRFLSPIPLIVVYNSCLSPPPLLFFSPFAWSRPSTAPTEPTKPDKDRESCVTTSHLHGYLSQGCERTAPHLGKKRYIPLLSILEPPPQLSTKNQWWTLCSFSFDY